MNPPQQSSVAPETAALTRSASQVEVLSWSKTIAFILLAIATFHLAYFRNDLAWIIVGYVVSLTLLTRCKTSRCAFYSGLAIGLATFAPQLSFFWTIFGAAAIALWMVLSLWTALFLLIARNAVARFGELGLLAVPFLWTALEYFRSELYYLRFSWLNIGYAFSGWPKLASVFGVYGIGFISFFAAIAVIGCIRKHKRIVIVGAAGAILTAAWIIGDVLSEKRASKTHISVAGVQLEFPHVSDVLTSLNRVLKEHPETDLITLSEYTFDGPVPDEVRDWCKRNQRWLVVGGKEHISEKTFRNTAFVISTNGEIAFKQAKSVPIQFFKDGLPAAEQHVWNSPWGKIGIAICYDFSYTRVIDELVRQGAEALIIPTMDIEHWGRYQHELHGRVAPTRAAEYHLPVFRVCSSGISQLTSSTGTVLKSASFPGQEEIIAGTLDLSPGARLPIDRFISILSLGVTGIVVVALFASNFSKKHHV